MHVTRQWWQHRLHHPVINIQRGNQKNKSIKVKFATRFFFCSRQRYAYVMFVLTKTRPIINASCMVVQNGIELETLGTQLLGQSQYLVSLTTTMFVSCNISLCMIIIGYLGNKYFMRRNWWFISLVFTKIYKSPFINTEIQGKSFPDYSVIIDTYFTLSINLKIQNVEQLHLKKMENQIPFLNFLLKKRHIKPQMRVICKQRWSSFDCGYCPYCDVFANCWE